MPKILTRGAAMVGTLIGAGGGFAEFMLENTVARTDVTPKNLFILPKGAIPVRLETAGTVLSNAVTTATLDVGKTGTVNFFGAALDVKAANFGDAAIVRPMKQSVPLTVDTQVVGQYAETGGASSAGGPWTVRVYYKMPGS